MSKKEQSEVYQVKLTFNHKPITKITITDYYQQKHSDITNELILEILKEKLSKEKINPYEWSGQDTREVFVWNVAYQGKKYRLIFWRENDNPQGLWIRNCYRID